MLSPSIVILRGEGPLRPAQQRRQHLAGRAHVVVDRLLAEDDQLGCSLSAIAFSSLATASGCNSTSVSTRMPRSAPMASAVRIVSAHCGSRCETATISRGDALFLQADRLLDGDLVERVHRHLHAGGLDAGAVRLHADLHVVVDHPLDRDQDFHGRPCRFQECCAPCGGLIRLFAPAIERAGPYAPAGSLSNARSDRSRVISSANSSNAAALQDDPPAHQLIGSCWIAVASRQADQASKQHTQRGKHQQGDAKGEERLHGADVRTRHRLTQGSPLSRPTSHARVPLHGIPAAAPFASRLPCGLPGYRASHGPDHQGGSAAHA